MLDARTSTIFSQWSSVRRLYSFSMLDARTSTIFSQRTTVLHPPTGTTAGTRRKLLSIPSRPWTPTESAGRMVIRESRGLAEYLAAFAPEQARCVPMVVIKRMNGMGTRGLFHRALGHGNVLHDGGLRAEWS